MRMLQYEKMRPESDFGQEAAFEKFKGQKTCLVHHSVCPSALQKHDELCESHSCLAGVGRFFWILSSLDQY